MLLHSLLYSKNSVLILAIVIMPICGVGIMFVLLFNLSKNLTNWAILSIIALFLILIVTTLLIVIKKKLSVPCKAIVNETGVSFKLDNKNFLYKYNDFFSGWENVTNISDTTYNEHGNFYQISFKNPTFTANFSAIKNKEGESEAFFKELRYYQDLYNLSHLKSPISSKNFYEGIWARIITWLFYFLILTVTITYFIDINSIDWWRTISLLCFGSVWIGNYYRNTKKLY